MVPVIGMSVRWEWDREGDSRNGGGEGLTDPSGICEIRLAASVTEAGAMKPTIFLIQGNYNNAWVDLGKATLDEERIARITARLTGDGMAASGAPRLPPFPEVSVRLPEGEVRADEACQVLVTVKNVGKGEFYRLAAVSESAVPALSGVKLEFGKVSPGETASLPMKFQVPREQASGPLPIAIQWSELNGYAPDPVRVSIMVKGIPRPRFATSVRVLDDNTGNSVGNGDGRIQKGEAVDLLVTVKNVGDGKARDVKIVLSGAKQEGVSINVREVSVGDIPPGESRQGRLTLSTKKAVAVAKLDPALAVVDGYLDVRQEETLSLPLDSHLPPSVLAFKRICYVGKEEIPIHGGAGSETALLGRAKPGTSLQCTGELESWLRVEMPNAGTGWVARAGVSFEPPAAASAPAATGGVVEILQKSPPLVAVARPLDGAKVRSPKMDVSGVVADDRGVSRVELRLNGKEVRTEGRKGVGVRDAAPQPAAREMSFSFQIDLAEGTNTIEVLAWDDEGLKTRKAVSVTYEKAKGEVFVVSIGIDAYENANVPRLKYAAADAKAVAECFARHLGIPKENTRVLLDKDATLSKIKNVLGDQMRKRAGKEDTIIIFYSGHGAPEADPQSADQDGVSKYLLPVDADRTSLYSTALPMDEVRTIFRRFASDRVIFLADTCYSGAAGGRTLKPEGSNIKAVNQDVLLARLKDTGSGRVILTASQGSEVSEEKDDLGHGVFTHFLLKGMDGGADRNSDGTVTVTELYEYVAKEVPRATGNAQHPLMAMDELVGEVVVGVVKADGKGR